MQQHLFLSSSLNSHSALHRLLLALGIIAVKRSLHPQPLLCCALLYWSALCFCVSALRLLLSQFENLFRVFFCIFLLVGDKLCRSIFIYVHCAFLPYLLNRLFFFSSALPSTGNPTLQFSVHTSFTAFCNGVSKFYQILLLRLSFPGLPFSLFTFPGDAGTGKHPKEVCQREKTKIKETKRNESRVKNKEEGKK